MKKKNLLMIILSISLLVCFAVFTLLVKLVDVGVAGESGAEVGFSTLNQKFFNACNYPAMIKISDILGYLAFVVIIIFAGLELVQLIKGKSIKAVDKSLMILSSVYVFTILVYVLFEVVTINYRPVLVNGMMEASYPSSHTMLGIVVYLTGGIQAYFMLKNKCLKGVTLGLGIVLSVLTTITRLFSGMHWLTDIIGAILISAFLVCLYLTLVGLVQAKNNVVKSSANTNTQENQEV